jgi:hypothetical protein
MVFSNTSTGTGIVEQVRALMRVDSSQWPTSKIVASCNNYLDEVMVFLLNNDKRFNPDDANHTKLPSGTTNLVANQTDYSFLTDEQGNRILALTRIEVKDSEGKWTKLEELDEMSEPLALDTVIVSGEPTGYYKIADNVIRLNRIPEASVTAGLKFYFLRAPSYFAATDTTKEPGVPAILHRGFVVSSAYDGALTLGLQNLQPLSVELQREKAKLVEYVSSRNSDVPRKITPRVDNCR